MVKIEPSFQRLIHIQSHISEFSIPRYSISKLSLLRLFTTYPETPVTRLAKPLDRSSHRSIPSHAHFLASIPSSCWISQGSHRFLLLAIVRANETMKKIPFLPLPYACTSSTRADISFHEVRIWRYRLAYNHTVPLPPTVLFGAGWPPIGGQVRPIEHR